MPGSVFGGPSWQGSGNHLGCSSACKPRTLLAVLSRASPPFSKTHLDGDFNKVGVGGMQTSIKEQFHHRYYVSGSEKRIAIAGTFELPRALVRRKVLTGGSY